MTTRELYELTRGHEGKPWMGGAWWFEPSPDADPQLFTQHGPYLTQPGTIEALLIGSAVKWLVENHYVAWCDKFENGGYTCTTNDHRLRGASPLAAVLAACEAAYKAGGGE